MRCAITACQIEYEARHQKHFFRISCADVAPSYSKQGYHDVVSVFLLVFEDDHLAFAMTEVVSNRYLMDFLAKGALLCYLSGTPVWGIPNKNMKNRRLRDPVPINEDDHHNN